MQEMKGEKTSDNKWIREENKNEMTMKKPQISKSDGDMVEKLEWGVITLRDTMNTWQNHRH